eukprot:CAMPEP_0117736784 /NCGR_PEP_ID=MMETSP0947-20121206/2141_1 /TAXON_ID=44440 /ORGANISM="Chattonella subsalsa, Strain CCMP2191" /LENGTH=1011 /DNA_ID=CAMNT_0005552151 /DNA_START=179 /DNA_END=3214 /DNA_ORIENTATION=+
MDYKHSLLEKIGNAIQRNSSKYQDLKTAFAEADENEKYVLTRHRFSKIVRKVLDPHQSVFSSTELQSVTDDFETETSGMVDYHSFLRKIKKSSKSGKRRNISLSTGAMDWVEQVMAQCVSAGKDYRAQFEKYDAKFTGKVTAGGFRACFEDLGANLHANDDEFEEVREAFTERGTTKVSYLEMLNTLGPNAHILGEEEWGITEELRKHFRESYDFQSAGKLKRAFSSLTGATTSRSSRHSKITSHQLYDSLGDLGFELRKMHVDQVFSMMDIRHQGKVTYPEFVAFVKDPYNVDVRIKTLKSLQKQRVRAIDLEEMLNSVDLHDAGTVTLRDLRHVLKDVGCNLSMSDVKRLSIPFDSKEEDAVTITSFMEFVQEARELHQGSQTIQYERYDDDLPSEVPALRGVQIPNWGDRERTTSMEEKVRDEFDRLAMSPTGKKQFHQVFDEMDRFGHDSLNLNDFKRALKQMGFKFSDMDCRKLFKTLDSDDSGDIDYQEFKDFVKSRRKGESSAEKQIVDSVRQRLCQLAQTLDGSYDFFQVFSEFSHDRCGDIPFEACVRGLMKVGLNRREAKQLTNFLDKDGDGSISFREFEAFALGSDVRHTEFDFESEEKKDSGSELDFISEEVRQRLQQIAEKEDGTMDFFQVFNEFSHDRSGDIPFEACVRGMMKVGLTRKEAKALTTFLDKDGSGSITFREFEQFATKGMKKMCRRRRSYQILESKIQDEIASLAVRNGDEDFTAVFNRFDRSGKGYLTKLEFFDAMDELGFNLSVQELRTIADHLDEDGDGQIDYIEFENFASQGLSGCVSPKKHVGQRLERLSSLESKVREEIESMSRTSTGVPDFYSIFCELDSNGNGEITKRQFMEMLDDLDVNLSTNDARDLANRLDTDDDGTISYEEFMHFAGKGKKSRTPKRRVRASPRVEMIERKVQDEVRRLAQTTDGVPDFYTVFNDIDRDGAGELNKREFRRALNIMGIKNLDDEDVDCLVDRLDIDGDGTISYKEFEAFALGRKQF